MKNFFDRACTAPKKTKKTTRQSKRRGKKMIHSTETLMTSKPNNQTDSDCEGSLTRVRRLKPLQPPKESTEAPPGSEEKIKVLCQRASSGQHLWHPKDATLATLATDNFED